MTLVLVIDPNMPIHTFDDVYAFGFHRERVQFVVYSHVEIFPTIAKIHLVFRKIADLSLGRQNDILTFFNTDSSIIGREFIVGNPLVYTYSLEPTLNPHIQWLFRISSTPQFGYIYPIVTSVKFVISNFHFGLCNHERRCIDIIIRQYMQQHFPNNSAISQSINYTGSPTFVLASCSSRHPQNEDLVV